MSRNVLQHSANFLHICKDQYRASPAWMPVLRFALEQQTCELAYLSTQLFLKKLLTTLLRLVLTILIGENN
jgi:hypothetical protein